MSGRDDDRPYGNFWQRAKRRLRLAPQELAAFRHEITLLHFRAGGLPAAFQRNSRALPFSYSQLLREADASAAVETNRPGQADGKSVPDALRKTLRLCAAQTKSFSHSLFRFLPLPEIFSETNALSERFLA